MCVPISLLLRFPATCNFPEMVPRRRSLPFFVVTWSSSPEDRLFVFGCVPDSLVPFWVLSCGFGPRSSAFYSFCLSESGTSCDVLHQHFSVPVEFTC